MREEISTTQDLNRRETQQLTRARLLQRSLDRDTREKKRALKPMVMHFREEALGQIDGGCGR
jgi:hypothetical protein